LTSITTRTVKLKVARMAQEVTVKLTYDDAVLDPPPTFSGVGIRRGRRLCAHVL
jgi:hypothetical protein